MIRRAYTFFCRAGFRMPALCYLMVVISIPFIINAGLRKNTFYYDFLACVSLFTACIAMFGFGVRRSVWFHPAAQPKYHDWLKLTPWNARKPLPLGPVCVSWEDGSMLILLSALFAWAIPFAWFAPLMAYAVPCIGVYSWILLRIENYRPVYFAWLTLGAAVWVASLNNPAYVVVVILIAYAILVWAAVHSLRGFPWNLEHAPEINTGHYRLLTGVAVRDKGFFLSPAWALMVGWWMYAALHCAIELKAGLSDREPRGILLVVYAVIAVFSVLPFYRAYFENVSSPVSFFGRFTHGPLVVPAYDGMRLLPLVALAIGGALPIWLFAQEVPLKYNLGLCAAGEILLLSLGPDPKKWHLTAKLRIQLPEREKAALNAEPQKPRAQNLFQMQLDAAAKKFFPAGAMRVLFSAQTPTPAPGHKRQFESTYLRVIPKSILPFAAIVAVYLAIAEIVWPESVGVSFSFLLLLFAILMGHALHRARGYHPAFSVEYTQWLKLTPWHPGKALPFGPVELVWQDVIPIVAIWLLTCVSMWFRFPDVAGRFPFGIFAAGTFGLIVTAILFLYCFLAAGLLCDIGRPGASFAILALMGAPLLIFNMVWWVVVLAAMTAIASVSMRRSIRDFPWDNSWLMLKRRYPVRNVLDKYLIDPQRREEKLSPLQMYLAPKLEMITMSRRTRVLFGLTIGWWVFVLVWRVLLIKKQYLDPAGIEFERLAPIIFLAAMGLLFGICFIVFGRILHYHIYTAAPMSNWGRLLTLRWIIWRHDSPFLIMLALALISISLPLAVLFARIPLAPGMAISSAAAFLILTLVGRSLRSWRLTGAHRAPKTMSR